MANVILLDVHERRARQVEEAWVASLDGMEIERAWTLLRFLGPNLLDGEDTLQVIRSDIANHGTPATCDAFTAHYNRVVERRVGVFETLYTVGGLLGQGGFSRVLRAEHARAGTNDIALKLTMKVMESVSVLQTIESEVAVWGKVSHPGIVQLYDVYELPTVSALVTELCPGGCLLDSLMDEAGMTEAHVLRISKQVIEAVVHLHEVARVAHRDIKPENILCTHPQPHLRGEVKLADFGWLTSHPNRATTAYRSTPGPRSTATVTLYGYARLATALGLLRRQRLRLSGIAKSHHILLARSVIPASQVRRRVWTERACNLEPIHAAGGHA